MQIGYYNLEDVAEILKMLDRTLKPKEKSTLLKYSHCCKLEDVLILENIYRKKLKEEWFLKERADAIKKGNYSEAMILSRLSDKKLTRKELETMLNKLIESTHLSDKEKKDLKNLEIHFKSSLVLAKKEEALIKAIASGNLNHSLKMAERRDRKLTLEELLSFFYYIVTHDNYVENIRIVTDKIKKLYPEESKIFEVL